MPDRSGYDTRADGDRDACPARNGPGGPQTDRTARLVTRIRPKGIVHPTRYLATATAVLAVPAWGDAHRRVAFGVLAGGFLVVTVVVGIRAARERARWRRLGDER